MNIETVVNPHIRSKFSNFLSKRIFSDRLIKMIINLFKKIYFYLFLLLFLNILAINHITTGLAGFLILIITFLAQKKFIEKKLNNINIKKSEIISFFFLLSYYIFSLTIIYYIFGLNKLIISFWSSLNLIPLIYDSVKKQDIFEPLKITSFLKNLLKYFYNLLNDFYLVAILFITLFLLSYFYNNPIFNGSPTPWINVDWFAFFGFFILSFFLIKRIMQKKSDTLTEMLFLFLIIGVASLKYQFPLGFDSMLHQASLKFIADNGQITPLTPFYIGQYVLEIVIYHFTNWGFTIIERWFMAFSFIFLLYFAGQYFLEKNLKKVPGGIIPASIIFMIPTWFYYSSPNSFSLLWALIAILAFFTYINKNEKIDYFFAFASTLSSLCIHPFIGLIILPWFIALPYFKKTNEKKRIYLLILTTFISSILVLFSFGLYNWLKGNEIIFKNPITYFNNFFSLFNDPCTYIKAQTTFPLWLLYYYEKISFALIILILVFHSLIQKQKVTSNLFYFLTAILWLTFFYGQMQFLFIIFSIILYFLINKKNEHGNLIILLISFSAFISAYLFFSVLDVKGYSNGDQINYTSRLLQMAKWFLWPLILLVLNEFFNIINKKKRLFKLIIAFCMAGLFTANWYLTYPRNDSISRSNINNIRSIDYEAINYIYNQEGGKNGYLVLSNQLFAAGAIQKYGFGPYYNTSLGKIFYYSVPMGGELNKIYNKIISQDNFDKNIIEQVYAKTGIKKIYFISTDYWSLSQNSKKQAMIFAKDYKNIDNKINIYFFSNEQ